jgi:hypothetical protein
MLRTRAARFLLIACAATFVIGAIAAPWFWPQKFYRHTLMGYVVGPTGTLTAEDVKARDSLSEETWKKTMDACLHFEGLDPIDIRSSPDALDEAMMRIGFDQKVVCETKDDRWYSIRRRLWAGLIGPILLMFSFFMLQWIRRGASE